MGKKKKCVKLGNDTSRFGEKVVEYAAPDSKKRIGIETSPSGYMKKKPTWSFSRIDPELWTIHGDFIHRIMPALINFESTTWHEIVSASKSHGIGSQSHAVDISKLFIFTK